MAPLTLEVHDLHYTYPGWPPTLRGVNLRIERGECGFLLGPSGGGKTTLLRAIAGLETSYTGTIRWNGRPIDHLPPHRREVGMLSQEPALFPHLDVAENIAFGMRYHDIPRQNERQHIQRWLELIGLPDKTHARIDELSGGERQRIALARTLAAHPRIVLLDEPLTALDTPLRADLGQRLRDLLRQQQVAALWVTHDEQEAQRYADHTWRLANGRTIEQ